MRHPTCASHAPGWRVALLLAVAPLATVPATFAADGEIVAVSSRTANGYRRTPRADNTFKPETYVFAQGTRLHGVRPDPSIDDLPFLKIAHIIAAPLRAQNYVPSFDPTQTDLLIFVSWGTTVGAEEGGFGNTRETLQSAAGSLHVAPAPAPPGTPQAALRQAASDELDAALMMNGIENAQRDRNNYANAGVLGFRSGLSLAQDLPFLSVSRDLVDELEANRYFVVLKAYDFRELATHKKGRLLWETRFSIRERGNRFDEQLPLMTKFASQFFGQDTTGLVREPVRAGKVEVGTPRVVDPE